MLLMTELVILGSISVMTIFKDLISGQTCEET